VDTSPETEKTPANYRLFYECWADRTNSLEMKNFCVDGIEVSLHRSPVHFVAKLLPLVLGLGQTLLQLLKVRSQLGDFGRTVAARFFLARCTPDGFRRQKLLLEVFEDGLVVVDDLGEGRDPILVQLAAGDGQLMLVGVQDALVAVAFLKVIL
jgi:hypothetical protein